MEWEWSPREGEWPLREGEWPCTSSLISACLLTSCSVQFDPDSMKTAEFDWWSKYYCSIDDPIRKQKKYKDDGYDKIVVRGRV